MPFSVGVLADTAHTRPLILLTSTRIFQPILQVDALLHGDPATIVDCRQSVCLLQLELSLVGLQRPLLQLPSLRRVPRITHYLRRCGLLVVRCDLLADLLSRGFMSRRSYFSAIFWLGCAQIVVRVQNDACRLTPAHLASALIQVRMIFLLLLDRLRQRLDC